jgi:galacturonosyltransferase
MQWAPRINEMKKEHYLIALVTNNDDDVYCFRKELIEVFIKKGYEILISCPDGPKFELMKDIPFTFDKINIDRRGTNIVLDFLLYKHYILLFKKNHPDVILTYTAKPNIYASIAARQLGIPYINNVTGLGSVLNKNGLLKLLIMKLFKIAYSKATCIMFQNSSNVKFAQEQGWIKGDYRLIPGSGVALNRFPVQDYPEGGNGIEGQPVVFNYIGRIMHDKGVDDYIEAAKKVKEKYPSTEFNLIGFIEPTELHYQVELEELCKQKIVFYQGNQKDIKPFIACAHATIHPSTYGEGMSNVLLESAASGRPLITTDIPGCKETLDDGITGFIYHASDVDQLIERIISFLEMNNEDRQKMGLKGRLKVEKYFSRNIVIDAYVEEIERALY